MTETELEYRTGVARLLNRGGVSAAPLRQLAVISIFDDEEYENYDVDFVSPRRRSSIAAVLTGAGFRQISGRTFLAPGGGEPIIFPKPGILGTDPSRPADVLLSQNHSVVLVTPTQALLLYLHHFGHEDASALAGELNALVWEQPANLDKVREWARAAGLGRAFLTLRSELARAQAQGIDLRRRHLFRSRLPR